MFIVIQVFSRFYVFSDLIRFKYCIASFESKHSSSRVFGLWKFVQNLFCNDLIRFIYCITYFESNHSSFESIQIILNIFKFVMKSFYSIQSFFDFIQSSCQPWFHILHYWIDPMCLSFDSNSFFFQCYFGPNLLLSHLPIYNFIHFARSL